MFGGGDDDLVCGVVESKDFQHSSSKALVERASITEVALHSVPRHTIDSNLGVYRAVSRCSIIDWPSIIPDKGDAIQTSFKNVVPSIHYA